MDIQCTIVIIILIIIIACPGTSYPRYNSRSAKIPIISASWCSNHDCTVAILVWELSGVIICNLLYVRQNNCCCYYDSYLRHQVWLLVVSMHFCCSFYECLCLYHFLSLDSMHTLRYPSVLKYIVKLLIHIVPVCTSKQICAEPFYQSILICLPNSVFTWFVNPSLRTVFCICWKYTKVFFGIKHLKTLFTIPFFLCVPHQCHYSQGNSSLTQYSANCLLYLFLHQARMDI